MDTIWLEAEQFDTLGGWSIDTQFVDQMGSGQLLATGIGTPVDDAVTQRPVANGGTYRLWVRCRDWLPKHSPGIFQVVINGEASETTFGKAEHDDWRWVDGGSFELKRGPLEVRLHDLTGWWGRCDAIALASDGFIPSDAPDELAKQREQHGGVSAHIEEKDGFDLVVVGAGPAGLGAALAAARNGCRVALLQDRPVVGGNASSEIQIPPMGYVKNQPDALSITGITEELFGEQGWGNFADQAHMDRTVAAEENIRLFTGMCATGVDMLDDRRIAAARVLCMKTGNRFRFSAPVFADCTGHGWIGYYAGAEFMMGNEGQDEFNETMAPVKSTGRTQGNSLYNAVIETGNEPVPFQCPSFAYKWTCDDDFEPRGSHIRHPEVIRRPANFDIPSRGKGRNPGDEMFGALRHSWWIEYGGMRDTIRDAERIRDELFRINIGLWNYAKNHNLETMKINRNARLAWLNYVAGTRESRRIYGDYVMTQSDFDNQTVTPDRVGFTDWGIDVHHPEGFWVKGNDCIHVYHGRRTCIPYRTLYARDIDNLFIAGRCHSATQLAFGATRVIRPVCMMGQAVGTAASLVKEQKTTPRGIYEKHIEDLQQRMLKDGCYIPQVRNTDPNDIALKAGVSASSHAPGAEPENVINGWNRMVGNNRNAWAPDPSAKGGHWIEISFPETFVDRIHLTFETEGIAGRLWVLEGETLTAMLTTKKQSPRRQVIELNGAHANRVRYVTGSRDVAITEIRIYGPERSHGNRLGG